MENTNIIPFFGIRRQYALHREELLTAIDDVYRSGQVLDGMYTMRFEEAIARRCDRAYAIAVNSGTQALKFALEALIASISKIGAFISIAFCIKYLSIYPL